MNYKKTISQYLPGKSKSSNNTAAVALALAGGVLLGSVIALLFAPSTGEETRGKLKDGARDLANNAKDKLENVKQRFQSGKQHLAENVSNGYHATNQ